jgi:3',5'-nucleoside bisphosphate phosphatase
MIDLHIHTTGSDGSHTPAEVVGLVKEKSLRVFAVADHNTIVSLDPTFALAQRDRLPYFPAAEIDTFFRDKDIHLLAYGIDFKRSEWRTWMEQIARSKLEHTRRRVEKLKALGFKIEYDDLMKITGNKMPTGGDYVKTLSLTEEGRADPRVRQYIDGPRSRAYYLYFYLDWLKAGKPAFVPFEEMECSAVIEKVVSLNAVPVIAHPTDTPLEYVRELKSHGLAGVEVYTSYHSPELSERWKKSARELGLFITAGSDFHGKPVKPDVEFGIECAEESEIIADLKAAVKNNQGIYLE